jgi:hypothetical protein
MKALTVIARQLGLAPQESPEDIVQYSETASPDIDAHMDTLPIGLLALIQARTRAASEFAHAEWPQRGQILRFETSQPSADERPFTALLVTRAEIPNVWHGYVVGPESELDYSCAGDVCLDDISPVHDPLASFVQTWNPVRLPIPSATACLAWLDREAMDRVENTAKSETDTKTLGIDSQEHTDLRQYRQLYYAAAAAWTARAAIFEQRTAPQIGLMERISAQLNRLGKFADIGQWRPAIADPMGPESEQTLLWTLAGLDIRIDPQACKLRKLGDDPHSARIDLYFNDELLESHTLTMAGDTAVIQLSPEGKAGALTLAIREPGGAYIQLKV